jgi:hypothetical protein
VNLAGQEGNWSTVPFTGSLNIAPPTIPGGAVGLSQVHIQFALANCFVPVYGVDQTWVTLSSVALNGAPVATTLASQGVSGTTTSFAGSGITESAQGTANYSATGFGCSTLAGGGAPCTGPFNLATPGPNTLGAVASGTYTPGSTAAVALVYTGSFRLAAGAAWGTVEVHATINGTLGAQPPPTCRPDFNHSGTLTVQDIFDFLGAWFAVAPSADFDGVNGVTVQDIFGFLAAWFAGC